MSACRSPLACLWVLATTFWWSVCLARDVAFGNRTRPRDTTRLKLLTLPKLDCVRLGLVQTSDGSFYQTSDDLPLDKLIETHGI